MNFDDLVSARNLFEQITEPDLRTWTLFISAHTQHGYPTEATHWYATLRSHKIHPDKFLLLSVAKACALSGNLSKAKEVHDDAILFGCASDTLLGNALIDMYAKCKCVDGARLVFDSLLVKDVVSWTSMAACYVNCGLPKEGLGVFREMGLNGVMPNPVTVSSVLPACSELKDLKLGREIHGFVVRNNMGRNVYVSSALVNMYASCLSMREAELVFSSLSQRDIVSWNVILTAYFGNKEFEKGIDLFYRRRERGQLNHASWNAVIGGCVQNGKNEMALRTLAEMQKEGFKPNFLTIASVLPAFTYLENLRGGREIHGYIFRHRFTGDLIFMTALVYMYAKCGEMEKSYTIFNILERKDTVAWNTMIISYSMHGNGREALLLFHRMIDSGVKPNSVTFIGVLSGCSHSRLIDEGLLVFNSMSRDHSVEPDSDHYSCVVDILGRAGRLNEAFEFIQRMPREPTASAWGALLSACRLHRNVDLARATASRLFEIEPNNPGNYVLLSNILVTAKLWDEASKIRKLMRDRGIVKAPGCSWVRVRNKVYTFSAGDKSNEQNDEIYRFLDDLREKMRLAGYAPNTDFVLQDVDQDMKEDILCNHSEKLAVAFGILNLSGKTSVTVFKNLRICGDCHNAMKFVAKIVGIKIIVRDSLRFHHFMDGCCSCHDFW